MSSTVTTATAMTMTDWPTSQFLVMIALIACALVLLAKESGAVARTRGIRRFISGLDLALAPLLMIFVVALAVRMAPLS